VYFRDVNAQVFGVSEKFTADPAHKFGGVGRRGGGSYSSPSWTQPAAATARSLL
jgi:hypothetical protein